MLREIGRLFLALIYQVAALTTGGLVVAAASAYEHWSGQAISWRAFVYGLVSFLVIAVFRVWQQQQQKIHKLNERLAKLRGSHVVEAYAEIGIRRTSENTFALELAFGLNVAAVFAAPDLFPGAHRVIWSAPFASPDYLVTIASAHRSAFEERSARTTTSTAFYFGVQETSVTVVAKGRRASRA